MAALVFFFGSLLRNVIDPKNKKINKKENNKLFSKLKINILLLLFLKWARIMINLVRSRDKNPFPCMCVCDYHIHDIEPGRSDTVS